MSVYFKEEDEDWDLYRNGLESDGKFWEEIQWVSFRHAVFEQHIFYTSTTVLTFHFWIQTNSRWLSWVIHFRNTKMFKWTIYIHMLTCNYPDYYTTLHLTANTNTNLIKIATTLLFFIDNLAWKAAGNMHQFKETKFANNKFLCYRF